MMIFDITCSLQLLVLVS